MAPEGDKIERPETGRHGGCGMAAGFLLLHRAGLDTQEKANILAAIRGEFSTLSVGRP